MERPHQSLDDSRPTSRTDGGGSVALVGSKPRMRRWTPKVKTGCITCRFVRFPVFPSVVPSSRRPAKAATQGLGTSNVTKKSRIARIAYLAQESASIPPSTIPRHRVLGGLKWHWRLSCETSQAPVKATSVTIGRYEK